MFFVDMGLFGLCSASAQDEFYLVVCERCGQVVKPQALKSHYGKLFIASFELLAFSLKLIDFIK